MVADFKERWAKVRETKPELPAYNVEMLETDPVKIVIEAFAYRELLWRARANQVARAVMLATTTGTDLDNFAADFGMTRRIIRYDDDGNPVYESDEEFRQRLTSHRTDMLQPGQKMHTDSSHGQPTAASSRSKLLRAKTIGATSSSSGVKATALSART